MKSWINPSSSDQKIFEIIQRALRKHSKLLTLIFDPHKARLAAAPEQILYEAEAFSSGEFLLTKVALDLWSASGNANIYDLLTVLDEDNFIFVIQAILQLKNPKLKIQFETIYPMKQSSTTEELLNKG